MSIRLAPVFRVHDGSRKAPNVDTVAQKGFVGGGTQPANALSR